MLYLEDYLEMIEHLPAELRDRFAEMREMDLSVQNRFDSLEKRQTNFFANCKRQNKGNSEEYDRIKKEYTKVIEDSSEKIQIAEESYNLVDRYLRKLDQELLKFKCELEADNRGITEYLEKRSLEMDNPVASSAKENRLPKKQTVRKNHTIAHPPNSAHSLASLGFGFDLGTASPGMMPAGNSSHNKSNSQHHKNPFNFPDPSSSPLPGGMDPSALASPSSMTYPLQRMGAGGNAIAAAASQAIAATQQLVPGRRTSSLKASYGAINLGNQTHEFSIGRELAGAAQSALAATLNVSDAGTSSGGGGGGQNKRQKASKRAGSHVDPGNSSGMLDVVNSSSLMDDTSNHSSNFMQGMTNSPSDLLSNRNNDNSNQGTIGGQDWNLDPNGPRYCFCNQVSYGDMVACDNVDCPYEWFHYPCVGITSPPRGKWYCPSCLARKKGRK